MMNSEQNISALVKNANKAVFNRDAERYDANNPAHFCSITQARIKEILGRIHNRTGGERLLDAGCGTGNILSAAQGLFREIVGFDISFGMCNQAVTRGDHVVCADFESMPFANGTFDVITSFSVVHHLPGQDALFKEVFRVLKPGGYLYADYDPNFFNRNTLRGKAYNRFYQLLTRLKHGPDPYKTTEREEPRAGAEIGLAGIAEYGRIIQNGLNPKALRQKLLQAGFRKAEFFYHDDFSSLSIRKEKRWKLRVLMKFISLLLLRARCDFLPYFVTLAEK